VSIEVKIKVLCPRCEGKMKMVMKRYPLGAGTASVRCPDCNGKGWIEVVFIEDTGGKVFP
jgi:DnaJ-class molecular chaperone